MRLVIEYPIYSLLTVFGVSLGLIYFLMKTEEGRYAKKLIGAGLVVVLALGYNVETRYIAGNEVATDTIVKIETEKPKQHAKEIGTKIISKVKEKIKSDTLELDLIEVKDVKIDTSIFGKKHIKGNWGVDLYYINTPEKIQRYYNLSTLTPKERTAELMYFVKFK
jgi:hypothetical protein